MTRVLVAGAGGFIGSHLVRRLKQRGLWVRGVDLKIPEFDPTEADELSIGDLRDAVVTATYCGNQRSISARSRYGGSRLYFYG